MAENNAKHLLEEGDALFSKRATLLSLWQEIAMQFYIERADFTLQRVIGVTFAENLMTSYPLVARRDLGNALGAMLRPKEKEWNFVETTRQDRVDTAGKKWLEYATGVQRRAMYDRASMFVRACKEGDHDFAALGQCAITEELNRARDALLYRNWHLRDVAWSEDEEGNVSHIHHKWKMPARSALRMFPKCGQKVKDLADRSPWEEVELRRVVMPAEDYEPDKRRRFKWMSIVIDPTADGGGIVEEINRRNKGWTIPRWQTVSGSQYAYSPATVCALPDARLLQAMTLTLLEAGERYTNPPMIAVQEAVRSDLQLFAGGVTWVDAEYDERLGEVLRPLNQDKSGMPIGREMRDDLKAALAECFYLNKMQMPTMGDNPQMTAFEVGQRVQEYIRQALPIFEPMEQEYNGSLCDETFDLLLHNGAFGPVSDIPRSVLGADIQFRFESPLTEMIDAQKGAKLVNAKQLLAAVADVDPTSVYVMDWSAAFRDALEGARTPMAWLHDRRLAASLADQHAKAAQQAQLLQGMTQASNIAKNLGAAAPGLQQARGAAGAEPSVSG
jgi:hypothetical protein